MRRNKDIESEREPSLGMEQAHYFASVVHLEQRIDQHLDELDTRPRYGLVKEPVEEVGDIRYSVNIGVFKIVIDLREGRLVF